jgi:hypothetical protein
LETEGKATDSPIPSSRRKAKSAVAVEKRGEQHAEAKRGKMKLCLNEWGGDGKIAAVHEVDQNNHCQK